MSETGLKQGVGLFSVVALGLGMAVGVAVFSVMAPASALAGPALLLAVPLAAIPVFIIALSYAFMGSALPTAGASYEWPRRFVSPAFGFMIAWLRIAGSVGAMLVLSLVLVRYLSMIVPLPLRTTMFAIFVVVFVLNFFGVGIAARAQGFLIAAIIAFFLLFGGWGMTAIEFEAFTPFTPFGWAGVLAAVPVLVGLFFGLEAATEMGDEVKDGRRNIPLGIAGAIISALVLYLLIAVVSIGVLGPQALAESEAPILDAANAFMAAPLAAPLVIAASVAAIGTSLNALCMMFSRYLFAMGRAGALPEVLGRVHPRFGTPHWALAAAFCLCVLGLFLPLNLLALFLAINIPTLLKYAGTCLAAAKVAADHPDLYRQASFRMGRRFTVFWSWLGIVASLGVVVMGLTADWRPYVALTVWGLIGACYYIISQRMKGA